MVGIGKAPVGVETINDKTGSEKRNAMEPANKRKTEGQFSKGQKRKRPRNKSDSDKSGAPP